MCKQNGNENGRLRDRQLAFVHAYLGDAKFTGVKAAELAGYKGDYWTLAVTASRLLKNDKVQKYIADFFSLNAMTPGEVIGRLAEQARADHTEYIDDTGAVDLSELRKAEKMHLVKGTKWDKDGNLVVEFHSAQRALELIGKYHGLLKDGPVIDVKGTNVTVYIPDNEREKGEN